MGRDLGDREVRETRDGRENGRDRGRAEAQPRSLCVSLLRSAMAFEFFTITGTKGLSQGRSCQTRLWSPRTSAAPCPRK